MKKWIASMLALGIVLFGSVLGFNAFKQKMMGEYFANMPVPVHPVEVAAVRSESWQGRLSSIGFIEPYQGVEISTSVAGLVSKIHFSSGLEVKAGDLLLELDAQVEQANLAAAKARMPALQSKLQRNRKLLAKKSVSQNAFDEAQAQYLSLQSEIISLQETINRRQIRAPFDGVMGLRQINLGQYLNAGAKVARLENLDKMRIRFIVPQKDIRFIETGMTVELNSDAYPQRSFTGKISAIDAAVDASSGTLTVQAEIPNAELLLRSGMYARVSVLLPILTEQLVIEQRAINFGLYGELVYVLREEGQGEDIKLSVEQRRVQVRERQGDVALIDSGLSGNERVVVAGHTRLQDGALVQLVEDSFVQDQPNLPSN